MLNFAPVIWTNAPRRALKVSIQHGRMRVHTSSEIHNTPNMKKTAFLAMGVLALMSILGTTAGCKPSPEEQARLDSLRVVDSLNRADSLHRADSIKAIADAAQKVIDDSIKLDSIAKKLKAPHGLLLKLYDFNYIVYAKRHGAGEAEVYIRDVSTNEETIVNLPGAEYLGRMASMKYTGDSCVEVSVHFNETSPVLDYYKIDLMLNQAVDHWSR